MPITDLMSPITKRLDALEKTVSLMYDSTKLRAEATAVVFQTIVASHNRQTLINWFLIMWPALLIALERGLF